MVVDIGEGVTQCVPVFDGTHPFGVTVTTGMADRVLGAALSAAVDGSAAVCIRA